MCVCIVYTDRFFSFYYYLLTFIYKINKIYAASNGCFSHDFFHEVLIDRKLNVVQTELKKKKLVHINRSVCYSRYSISIDVYWFVGSFSKYISMCPIKRVLAKWNRTKKNMYFIRRQGHSVTKTHTQTYSYSHWCVRSRERNIKSRETPTDLYLFICYPLIRQC